MRGEIGGSCAGGDIRRSHFVDKGDHVRKYTYLDEELQLEALKGGDWLSIATH